MDALPSNIVVNGRLGAVNGGFSGTVNGEFGAELGGKFGSAVNDGLGVKGGFGIRGGIEAIDFSYVSCKKTLSVNHYRNETKKDVKEHIPISLFPFPSNARSAPRLLSSSFRHSSLSLLKSFIQYTIQKQVKGSQPLTCKDSQQNTRMFFGIRFHLIDASNSWTSFTF